MVTQEVEDPTDAVGRTVEEQRDRATQRPHPDIVMRLGRMRRGGSGPVETVEKRGDVEQFGTVFHLSLIHI